MDPGDADSRAGHLWSLSTMPGIPCPPLFSVMSHKPIVPYVFSRSHSFFPSISNFLYTYSRQGTVLA